MLKEFLLGGYSEYVVPGFPIPARDYYVAIGGSGDGLSAGSPTNLATVKAATLHDGDNIYFNRGETFDLVEWSISSVNTLTFDAYGSGAKPILRGSTSLTAATWTDQGSNQWSTPLASAPKWVYINGTAAKQAESAWIPVTAVPSAQVRRVLAATVNAFPDSILDAIVFGKDFDFRISHELDPTAYDSGTGNITLLDPINGTIEGEINTNMPIKFANQRQFISATGDWCYVGGLLYVRSTATPAGTDIRASTADFGISCTAGNGITVENLDFRHYYKYGFLGTTVPELTINECEFNHNRATALRLAGVNNVNVTITNSVAYKCGLRGFEMVALDGAYIAYNHIHEICTDANMGRPFDFSKVCGTGICHGLPNFIGGAKTWNNSIFEYNDVHDVGYECINVWGAGNHVRKNKFYNYSTKFQDTGAVYLSYGNYLGLDRPTTNNQVYNNYIHDGVGSFEGIAGGSLHSLQAIYFDNGAAYGNTVDRNFIVNPGLIGILLNIYTTDHTVTNNIVVGGTESCYNFREDSAGLYTYFNIALMRNVVFTGNIGVSKTTAARVAIIYNKNNNGTFNPFSTLTSNHYVQPYTANINARTINSGSTYTQLPLANWKTYTGLDANATEYSNYKVTPAADDVVTVFNDSDVSIQVNIPVGHTDVYGNAPSNPYTLTAWTGMVYLKS